MDLRLVLSGISQSNGWAAFMTKRHDSQLRVDRTNAEMTCQTARVHYHKAFWVVVGTAAPVIALAGVVAMAQLRAATARSADSSHRRNTVG